MEIQTKVNQIQLLHSLKQPLKASEIREHLDEYRERILTLRDNFIVGFIPKLFPPLRNINIVTYSAPTCFLRASVTHSLIRVL